MGNRPGDPPYAINGPVSRFALTLGHKKGCGLGARTGMHQTPARRAADLILELLGEQSHSPPSCSGLGGVDDLGDGVAGGGEGGDGRFDAALFALEGGDCLGADWCEVSGTFDQAGQNCADGVRTEARIEKCPDPSYGLDVLVVVVAIPRGVAGRVKEPLLLVVAQQSRGGAGPSGYVRDAHGWVLSAETCLLIDVKVQSSRVSVKCASSRAQLLDVLSVVGFVVLVFCTGTAEYLVAGVLPQLANDMSVDVATAGQAVTAYALGVAVGGPIISALTVRLPRKGLALTLAGVFIAGTAITVAAPSFGWVIVGRVVSACAQATLFAIALMTTTVAMGAQRQGRAIALVTSGLTVATVLGVPLGSLLGGSISWRTPFIIVAGMAVAAVAIVALSMPRAPAPSTGVSNEFRTLLRIPVLLAVGTTVVGFAGVSVVFTYLVPLLFEVTGISPGAVPALLLAYGVGGFLGNLVAGHLTDHSLSKTLTGVLVALAAVLAVFPLLAGAAGPMIVLVLALGLLSTATIAPLQSLVLRHAGEAPTLSLAVNVGAFNLANAIGAALGGLGVASGLLRWSGFGASLFALIGLALSVIALRATPSSPDSSTS